MTDRDKSTRQPDDEPAASRGKDVMHGRSFAGANIANTERDQTRERQRIAEHGENLDEYNEVTEAEIEAREGRRAERNED